MTEKIKKINQHSEPIDSAKNFLVEVSIWFLFAGTFLFFYYISTLYQKAGFFHVLLKTNSFNSYLFYALKEPLFLNFNFHQIHPYYLLLSICNKFLSARTLVFLIFGDFFILFYFALRYKILNFYTYTLWLVSCLFLFKYNATGLFLWFQLGLYFIFEKLNEKIIYKNTILKKTLFYIFLSFIFLPGFFMIFVYHILRHLIKYDDLNLAYREILREITPFGISFFTLAALHIIFAYSWFDVPASSLLNYIFLPMTMVYNKNITNNESFSDVVISNLSLNSSLYVLLLSAIVIWVLLMKDKFIGIKLLFIILLLFAGLLITRLESLFFPISGFFLLLETNLPVIMNFNKKMVITGAVLTLIFLSLIKSSRNHQEAVDVVDENIIVSFSDINKLNFDSLKTSKIKKLIIIDLKIIPENVVKLIDGIKNQKIDVMLNENAIRFLEEDLEYEKKVSALLEKDNYSIYLKSSIHPDQEKWPFRRGYILWQTIKKINPDARMVLF